MFERQLLEFHIRFSWWLLVVERHPKVTQVAFLTT
jgi:hypothetical protein